MLSFTFILSIITLQVIQGHDVFNYKPDSLEKKYRPFTQNEKLFYTRATRDMFTFAYDSYMKHAFPKDELNPILCEGRGPDLANPDNININDVLGNYSLSLIDSLGTLAVLGNISEFHNAVRRVVETVSFHQNSTVQVFEVTIRVLGGLLTAHLLMTDENQIFGNLKPYWYDKELLELAHDLGNRLLPAFEQSQTGIPFPRVNLLYGVPVGGRTETCTAGAGSLLLEFGILSRLTGDPTYEIYARKAIKALWSSRNKETGLPGNVIDATTGRWIGTMSGLGAGLDSFYEYLLKSYILFGDPADLDMFKESYQLIKQHMRRGRPYCNSGVGEHPLYVNVNMQSGATATSWVDSLQAAFAGVQVLYGDIQEAICVHALYYSLWRKYGALPERYNWQLRSPDISFYPLRPELMESTYLLYRATKNPFYLHVGVELLDSLNNFTRAQCGYATIHSVLDKSLEDRMESFFLSETCKYLYLLFDEDNPLNKHLVNYLFSTEGHIIPITKELRETTILEDYDIIVSAAVSVPPKRILETNDKIPVNKSSTQCAGIGDLEKIVLPLQSRYLSQLNSLIGVSD